MTPQFQNFLLIIQKIEEKRDHFSYLKCAPGLEREDQEISEKISENCLHEIQNHFNEELSALSQLFSIRKRSAIIIASLLIYYWQQGGHGFCFITENDIIDILNLDFLDLWKLSEEMRELEAKGILKISILDTRWLEKLGVVDSRLNNYLFDLEENRPLNSCNIKSFELTENFIKKISNLGK